MNLRLIFGNRSFNMDIDEALLTGESVPVNKSSPVIEGELVPLGDRVNMCYSSTTLTKGRGRGKPACQPRGLLLMGY